MRNLEIATRWLHQAEPLCLEAGLDYIDVIIDRAGTDYPITEAFQQISPAVRWASLLDGTPEEGLLDDEPVLVRLHWSVWQHKDLLAQIVQFWGNDARLMLLISPLSFDLLRDHLSALTQFEWGEQSGLLRYFDSDIFPELFKHVLTADQQALFCVIAQYWSWLDRDLIPHWMKGSSVATASLPELPPPLVLEDRQINFFTDISDAHLLTRESDASDDSPEKHFQRLFAAAIAADNEGYIGTLSEFIKHSGRFQPEDPRQDKNQEGNDVKESK